MPVEVSYSSLDSDFKMSVVDSCSAARESDVSQIKDVSIYENRTKICTRAIGNGPRHFESWSSDEDDTPSPYYHTNGRIFELLTDLTCIAPGEYLVVLSSNS
ncbi:hypothetical protein TNCV_1896051 [Trichonephila clavipes]|nr:hypothetical protein TNCV_1896051 [Trichonephila clavipes]